MRLDQRQQGPGVYVENFYIVLLAHLLLARLNKPDRQPTSLGIRDCDNITFGNVRKIHQTILKL